MHIANRPWIVRPRENGNPILIGERKPGEMVTWIGDHNHSSVVERRKPITTVDGILVDKVGYHLMRLGDEYDFGYHQRVCLNVVLFPYTTRLPASTVKEKLK